MFLLSEIHRYGPVAEPCSTAHFFRHSLWPTIDSVGQCGLPTGDVMLSVHTSSPMTTANLLNKEAKVFQMRVMHENVRNVPHSQNRRCAEMEGGFIQSMQLDACFEVRSRSRSSRSRWRCAAAPSNLSPRHTKAVDVLLDAEETSF